MKIAFVSPFPDEPERIAGGVAGATKYLADELAARAGVAVSVVVPQGNAGDGVVAEQWGSLRIYRLGRPRPWRGLPGTPYEVAFGKRQLSRFLAELAPDVVHFQGSAFLAAGYERPHVLTIHGIAEKDALWDRRWGAASGLKRWLLATTERYGRKRADNVILISDCALGVLPPSQARRLWRIPNPIAESFFGLPRAPQPGRVFCCSRITPLKNTLGMIEAFAEVARRLPEASLRVAGAGEEDYIAQCRAAAERLGLSERVRFLGGLTVEAVQKELSQAACYVLPSFQENAPLSLAEAMAAGTPSVAAGVGGVPEMVEDGVTGLLVEPRDARSIAEATLRMLRDRAFARAVSGRAQRAAQARHGARAVADRTLEVYRQLLASS